jgi:hypothetical protein
MIDLPSFITGLLAVPACAVLFIAGWFALDCIYGLIRMMRMSAIAKRCGHKLAWTWGIYWFVTTSSGDRVEMLGYSIPRSPFERVKAVR